MGAHIRGPSQVMYNQYREAESIIVGWKTLKFPGEQDPGRTSLTSQ